MSVPRLATALVASGLVAAVIGVPFSSTALASPAAVPPIAAPAGANPSGGAAASGSVAGLTAKHSLRSSVTDENFYFVMADRFENGSTANDEGGLGSDPMVSGFDPTKRGFYNGGDLVGLKSKLDYIQNLG